MNNPQNPTIHPEIGPSPTGRQVDNNTVVTSGVITFNQTSLSSEDPRVTLQRAINEGDSIARRIEQFKGAITTLPEQK